MKYILIALTLSLFSSFSFAGEFSKIDQTVRETIIESFNKDIEGSRIYTIDFSTDIWNLKVVEYNTEHCLMEVSAYASLPSNWGSAVHQVWVCITKDENGDYEGEVFDYDLL